jgi:invasion protein IalB
MTYRTASVAAKTIVLSVPATVAVALALTVAPHAFAQQPSTTLPAAPAQATPRPDTTKTPPGKAAQNEPELKLTASPWTKYCTMGLTRKSSKIKAEEICFTASDAHLASGEKLAIALLIEPEGSDQKLFRVTLPLGVALIPGARVVIDEKDAMTAPYVVCHPKDGCMADYKADAELIAKLKTGRNLAIQAFDKGRPISFTLPLAGFAKAYDGPPSDPTGLNGQQNPRDELQHHSDGHLPNSR